MVGATERGEGVGGETEDPDTHVHQEEWLWQAEGELKLLEGEVLEPVGDRRRCRE